MLSFSEVNISDKSLFDSYLKASDQQASEMTFTNIYMWRHSYKFRYALIEGLLYIISVSEKGLPFCFMPLGNVNKENFETSLRIIKDYFNENNWTLYFKRVSENNLSFFKQISNSEILIEIDTSNSDYVYLTEDLAHLKGKKFDGKRNHINKFKKTYEYEYFDIDESNISLCYEIMDNWCMERNCEDHDDFFCEKIANIELLKNYDQTGCKGLIVKVNGVCEAFTVGEMLNSNTAVIHIEKANSKINGLYTFVNQQFINKNFIDATFVNREQDLGIEGLKKAKLSYNPVKMINKYTIAIL